MTLRPSVRTLSSVAALALAATACSSTTSTTSTTSTNSTTSTTAASTTTAIAMTGSLNVLAAASLTGAFTAAKSSLAAADPGLSITFDFAGSNALVTQITQGAPADVFASADTRNMQKLVDAGLVETPVTFARNKLEIAVAAGNPKHIAGLADLARADLTVVLEAASVPAGDYARQVLAAQHITVTPRSLETDVKSAVAKVTSGEADATVVYTTDVTAAGARIAGVVVPDDLQPAIAYPIAVVKATTNPSAARGFLRSAVSGEVQRAVEAAGFLPPG